MSLVAGVVLLLAAAARGDDLARQAVPRRWIEQLQPENLPALTFPKYYKDLDKARAMCFAGRYKLALMTLAKSANADATQAALIRGECLAATGRHDEALLALSDPPIKDKPRVQILRAQILADLWRMDQAVALIQEVAKASPRNIVAQYQLGQIAERAGNTALANDAYTAVHDLAFARWEDKGTADFDNPEELVCLGRALDRWATLNLKYKEDASLHNRIFKIFVQTYDVIDVGYWPAHLAAAEFALARSNEREGGKELAAVLAANPNCLRARVLAGEVALSKWNFDGADAQIAAIRQVDPSSVDALLLECFNLIQQRRPADAMFPVDKALARQAGNLDALGLKAAVYALQLKDDKTAQVLKDVERIDPDNASAYLQVASALGSMRQYPRAASMYKVAIERAPWWMEARNGLGLLYTQSGDEDLARRELEAAKVIDPFNFRTHNYLILLDKMAQMGRLETENFIILYDAKEDPLVPEYFAPYMEAIHKEVCGAFKAQLKDKTMIEVFPTHDQFSVRTTGSPWIGTVGASTGRVIALVSPRRGRQTLGTYNWATVLRHEYTHTVTLAATDNRITHWMTEGLAVMQEGEGLRWEWAPMLHSAVTRKQLFTMENLTWGFVRPKRPTDRTLAYAQSHWVCRYIAQNWGYDTLIAMMGEFAKGKEQADVFPRLLGRTLKDFDKEFYAWCEKTVAAWGYDAATTKKYNDLTKKAQDLVDKSNYKEALKAWEEAAKMRPMDALPHQRLAGLYLVDEIKDPRKAIEHLVRLHEVALKDNRYAKKLARVYADLKEWPKAQQYGLEGVYIEPYDLEAHELLARIYEEAGNKEGLEREKRMIPIVDQLLKRWRQENSIDPDPTASLSPALPE
jgi:tetratricopeptide (TPR) repeat protein